MVGSRVGCSGSGPVFGCGVEYFIVVRSGFDILSSAGNE